jgi:Flp pilus assembly pilin Flp
MRQTISKLWTETDGVLSFEWIVLVTLLTVGVVAGITAARDAIIDEMGDASEAMLALDGTYTIDFPLILTIDGESTGGASDSGFVDALIFVDCGRTAAPLGQ